MNRIENKVHQILPWLIPALIPLFLVLVPVVYSEYPLIALALILFPGLWLYTFLGYFVHENWHGYFGAKNRRTYALIYATIGGMDTQLYDIAHSYHHQHVHTYKDFEFYPLGNIANPSLKRLNNFLELVLGLFYVNMLQLYAANKSPDFKEKFSKKRHYFSTALTSVFYFSCGLFAFILGAEINEILICYLLLLWLASVTLHLGQLIQHANIIQEGSSRERALLSRNLHNNTMVEKVIHFMTHNDCIAHTEHHMRPSLNNRPFANASEQSSKESTISFNDFLRELKYFLLLPNENYSNRKK